MEPLITQFCMFSVLMSVVDFFFLSHSQGLQGFAGRAGSVGPPGPVGPPGQAVSLDLLFNTL